MDVGCSGVVQRWRSFLLSNSHEMIRLASTYWLFCWRLLRGERTCTMISSSNILQNLAQHGQYKAWSQAISNHTYDIVHRPWFAELLYPFLTHTGYSKQCLKDTVFQGGYPLIHHTDFPGKKWQPAKNSDFISSNGGFMGMLSTKELGVGWKFQVLISIPTQDNDLNWHQYTHELSRGAKPLTNGMYDGR